MSDLPTNVEFQIKAYCDGVIQKGIHSLQEVRTRTPRGGYYRLIQVDFLPDGRAYFISVSGGNSCHVFKAEHAHIEEIFGYEAAETCS